MADRYRVAARSTIDLASGGTFAPGELAVGVDPKAEPDKQHIEEGRLVKTAASRSTTKKEEAES